MNVPFISNAITDSKSIWVDFQYIITWSASNVFQSQSNLRVLLRIHTCWIFWHLKITIWFRCFYGCICWKMWGPGAQQRGCINYYLWGLICSWLCVCCLWKTWRSNLYLYSDVLGCWDLPCNKYCFLNNWCYLNWKGAYYIFIDCE